MTFLATLRAAFAAWLDAHTDADLARVLGAERAKEVRS